MSIPRREFEEGLRVRRRDSRRRILDAAAALIEERRWHEIALEQVMVRAELSRTAFYRHFDERSDLLLALIEESGVGQDPAGVVWKESPDDDPADAVRAACTVLSELFVRHGRLLRAAAEAAVTEPAVAKAYQAFADSLECFGRRPFTTDPEVAAAALAEIWAGAVYRS